VVPPEVVEGRHGQDRDDDGDGARVAAASAACVTGVQNQA
jgi:hypothetical protein